MSLWMKLWAATWRLLALDERGMATLSRATKANWDASIPEYWDKSIMYEADRDSLFSKLSGPEASDAPVIEKEDLMRSPGDQIDFTVLRRLIGAGQTGNAALQGNEENIVNSVFSVAVDEVRHGTAADHIATVEAIYDFQTSARKLLADWLTRYLDDQVLNQVLNTDTNTTIYAGGKTTRASLGPGDVLLPNELRKLHMAAYRRGVEAFSFVRGNRMPFPVYGCALSTPDYYALSNDSDFRQDVRLAQERGDQNTALTGAIDLYQGIQLYVFRSINNGDGFVGTYLRPEARLGAALTAAATTISTGVASPITGVNYNKYLLSSGTILIDSEQITLGTVNTTSSITGVTRAAGGTTGVAHSAGALITANNLGRVLLFGKAFMMRAWAERPTRIQQKYDYEQEWGLGIRFINGVKSVLWGDSTVGKALVMETYAPNPSTV